MASPELWKDYFDNPTLSKLTIRLSDRLVHVHRIVLCRGSEYFEKLLTGSFKARHSPLRFETGAKEIELHEDDPVALVGALRYIYSLDYDKAHMDAVGERQFLAALFVTAAKYQLNGLENKTYEEMRKIATANKLPAEDLGRVDDFLNAVETVLAGTPQDCPMRKLMIDYYFWNLPALNVKAARLSDLLTNNADLGAEIISRFRSMYNPFEGSWYCKGLWHPDAQPSCFTCKEPFSKQWVLSNRGESVWYCVNCGEEGFPHCWDSTCNSETSAPVIMKWVWEAASHDD